MPPLLVAVLTVLVFVHSISRFRHIAVAHDARDIPGPASAFTTAPNYWGGAIVYGASFTLTYVFLLLVFQSVDIETLFEVVAQLIPGFDATSLQLPEDKEQIPIWLAGLLTFAIPNIPFLSRIDRTVRARIQQFVGIPEFAWHFAERLDTHRDYRYLGDTETYFNRIATGPLADCRVDVSELRDTSVCNDLFVRMLYILELLKDWASVDSRYHRFAEEQKVTREAIEARLQTLNAIAVRMNHDQEGRVQSMMTSTLDDAWLQLRRYVACAAMACERSAEGVEQRVRLLGFSRSERVPYSDFFSILATTFVLTFIATQAVVLLWDWVDTLLSQGDGTVEVVATAMQTQFYADAAGRAAQISILHALAIAVAMVRLRPQMPYPWLRVSPFRDLIIGWVCGTVIAACLPFTYTTETVGPLGQVTIEVAFGWPWFLRAVLLGVPVGFAAFSFIRLITKTAFLTTGRMSDMVRQGLYTSIPTVVVVMVAVFFEIDGASDNNAKLVLIAFAVTFVIGSIVGAILPVRYRRKREYYRVTHDQVATVVGAGVAGLACAQHLHDHGFQVQVLEAAPGAGGRVRSTLYDQQEFDIGAQVFQQTPSDFAPQVQSWLARGLVSPWHPRVVRLELVDGQLTSEELTSGEARFTGVKRMDRFVTDDLLERVSVNYRSPVTALSLEKKHRWSVYSGNQCLATESHYVVLAVPAQEAKDVLGDKLPIQIKSDQLQVGSVWVCALTFAQPLTSRVPNVGLYQIGYMDDTSSILNRVYCVSDKPDRDDSTTRWLLVAQADWSAAHKEDDEDKICAQMVKEFWLRSGFAEAPLHTLPRAYYWTGAGSHAQADDPQTHVEVRGEKVSSRSYFFDEESGLGLCGDWCSGFGVGFAWASGKRLAQQIIEDAEVPSESFRNQVLNGS